MAYSLLRPLLFSFSAETAHELTLDWLSAAARLGLTKALPAAPKAEPRKVMGLEFPNAVGLAAGLDKNGHCIDGLAALGFGFVEIGTITPRPQPGNPQPRLFRLPQRNAIINRMGFNNEGVDQLLANVDHAKFRGILGINIGKNAATPVENALDDYLICLQKVYRAASYVTVNISSPNTPGLRTLQYGDSLKALLAPLHEARLRLAQEQGKHVPIAVKIAPDMSEEEVRMVADTLVETKMDAVIATNTTLSREAVKGLKHADEAGGLSGEPVRDASTAVIKTLSAHLQGALPIIGVGGILCGRDAQEKLEAGASLVQLYSGLIYRGPGLVRECIEATAKV
ncbi:quinone-dependent dihydroorotate dehydrogenase [Balneatrix alpica]|uniref:Dihydroorotate dehydrogenase (quinone) n=1 Tax=Balneatrix alpica TaxID=75684 RepID=A0ABV5Z722_9GAMM|nr:quinone-dependent dihydroorotate dehydrogenase [Balneatrix alpica]